MAGPAAEHREAPRRHAPPAPGGPAVARGLDPATGGVLLSATDVHIPGTPPLRLVRHLRPGTRSGRRFGRVWGSTLDQCLILRRDGVRLIAEDGRVLDYPVPTPGGTVLPATGPRWPLAWDGNAGGAMTVRRPESGHTLRFHPVPGTPGAELPLVELADRRGNVLRVTYDGGLPAEVASGGHRVGITVREGRVAELRLLSAPDGPLLRRFHYDPAGNLTSVDSGTGPVERLRWDARRRLTGRAPGTGPWFQYAYDEAGRVTRAGTEDAAPAVLTYEDEPRRTTLTDSLGHTTVFAFDGEGRLVAETDPLGHTTRRAWGPHGLLVAETDPLGRTTRWERNAHGGLTAVILPDGSADPFPAEPADPQAPESWPPHPAGPADGAPGGAGHAAGREAAEGEEAAGHGDGTHRVHDSEGRLTELSDDEGNRWTWEYDPAGRLTSASDSSGRSVRYRYDAAGQCVGWTNGAGQRVSNRFDACGRLTEQRTESDVARYHYDKAGRLVAAENAETRVSWEYDATGAVLSETRDGRTVRFTRDAHGRRTGRLTPSGAVTGWAYDQAGRPAALRAGDGHLASIRDAEGREVARYLPGGPVLRFEPDAAGRPAVIVLPSGQRRVLHRREDGTPVRVEDSVAGVLDIAVDPAGRVVSVRGPGGTEEYRWEAEGGFAGAAPGYQCDGQGRVVKSGRLGFSWDALDRLTDVVTSDGQHWHYVYDPLGRRVAKQLLDDYGSVVSETTLAWEGLRPAEEVAPDGTAVAWHWAADGHRPLAQTTRVPGGAARWHAIVTDSVGTPTELIGTDGSVAWQRRASFWGAPASGTPAGAADCRLGFPGQLFDVETGLHYHVHRYYDARTGRYLSPDPCRVGPGACAYVPHPLRDSAPDGLLPGTGQAPPLPGPARLARALDLAVNRR
ncbi:RHS repeat-associated core domain-containing protein [Streptomyces marincola]|uniref:RHS repeat-associated core domain-containing protein n=1 Tax=Streptomyces marincola TaxID=2878388 RepID=UPI001CF568C3|nr:DUF6531 domain-containing protein [Streptomyces marincola]UCM87780.1 DUF6531 domain-containing protein [Streptomyces marincola]